MYNKKKKNCLKIQNFVFEVGLAHYNIVFSKPLLIALIYMGHSNGNLHKQFFFIQNIALYFQIIMW